MVSEAANGGFAVFTRDGGDVLAACTDSAGLLAWVKEWAEAKPPRINAEPQFSVEKFEAEVGRQLHRPHIQYKEKV